MGWSLKGHTWGNPKPISDPTVKTMMAYFYAHSTGVFTEIQDVLDPVAERYAVYQVINAGVVRVFQIVVDAHQLLCTGGDRVCQQTGLVPPNNGLCPGVHCPGVVAVPNGVFT